MSLMIKGLGIDLVDFDELTPKLNDAFIDRILSPQEIEIYNKISNPERKVAFLAGRFAGKEAFVKAYQSFGTPLNFKEVSILPNGQGAPYIVCDKIPTDRLTISISHTKSHAIAIVIRE